jgi:hypothetical protein
MKLNGNMLLSIKDGTTALAEGIDYINSGASILLKKDYLANHPPGPIALKFSFNAGNDDFLVINVVPIAGME